MEGKERGGAVDIRAVEYTRTDHDPTGLASSSGERFASRAMSPAVYFYPSAHSGLYARAAVSSRTSSSHYSTTTNASQIKYPLGTWIHQHLHLHTRPVNLAMAWTYQHQGV